MTSYQPVFNQINLAVKDMAATLAFYRKLGLVIDAEADADHVAVNFPGGVSIEFDTVELTKRYDCNWKPASGGVNIGFALSSREAVDEVYAFLVEAGYHIPN